jgi:hypothetical protein
MRNRDFTPLGYQPVLGTLNLTTGEKAARKVRNIPEGVGIQEGDETGTFHPMMLDGFGVHVRAYQRGIEVVAPVHLREHFGLKDGDAVTLRWSPSPVRQRIEMPAKVQSMLKRAHRRNGEVLLRAAGWSFRRGVDLYQGGQRSVDDRWIFIRDELKQLEQGSVLDIGCAEGTFVKRAADELGWFGIGVERNRGPVLNGEVRRLTAGRRNYAVIYADLNPDAIRRLPKCDVALCLAVVHHVINKSGLDAGREFLTAVASVTRCKLIFEMGAPKHPDFVNSEGRVRSADEQAPAIRSLLESAGWTDVRPLGRTQGFKGRHKRDVFVADVG